MLSVYFGLKYQCQNSAYSTCIWPWVFMWPCPQVQQALRVNSRRSHFDGQMAVDVIEEAAEQLHR